MKGWNPASKYYSLTCPESRCPSPVGHKVLHCLHSCCLMPCEANSTSFPCGLLLLPLSHGRGHEPSLQGPILVCMNRLVHIATEALQYHQKNLFILRVATIPVYTSVVEAEICWQRSMQCHGDGEWVWYTSWREERWKESGFASMEKECLREADVRWLTDGYQSSLRSSQGSLVLKNLVLTLVIRDKRYTLQDGKFCLHIRNKTTVVQPWDRARCGDGGMSTAERVQNVSAQGTDQADLVLKAVELGKGDGNKDLQMCLRTWMISMILCAQPAAPSHVLIMS